MKFSRSQADVLVPGGGDVAAALRRVTHLCVAAHQDDIEIMAHEGICAGLDQPDTCAFAGVVVTDGGGSPRAGAYAQMTDEEMKRVRMREQQRAAELGRYAAQIQLSHPSSEVKRPVTGAVEEDLFAIFQACRARVLYLHNPADKHDTHVAVLQRCLAALRRLPREARPARVLGCEVWRSLDWLVDTDKVALDAGGRPEMARQLLAAFDSQISGGKRYDLATEGRRAANATFHTSHAVDRLTGITWAMDLSPLVHDDSLDLVRYTLGFVERLRADVEERLRRFC